MTAMSLKQQGLKTQAELALRRFNAWWEGYAFDPALEKADIESRRQISAPPEFDIPPLLWGAGRDEPGDPAWSMRHARSLGLGPKSRVTIFGAGQGASIRDMKTGARWNAAGMARRTQKMRGLDLKCYDEAMTGIERGASDGAVIFFELHRDGDPCSFARFVAEHLKPGAPAAFIDFALAKIDSKIGGGFDGLQPGAPRLAFEYIRMLKEAGFHAVDVVDETRVFLPLVARGWSSWRRAYEAASQRPNIAGRAESLRYLSEYAHMWAERFEALKSGALQVVRLPARRLG
jgi:hypothetical protein